VEEAVTEALADAAEGLRACVVLTRAGQVDEKAAKNLALRTLRTRPHLWASAYEVASQQAGPFVPALESLAELDDTPLPLAELRDEIPFGHGALRQLALIAARRAADGEHGEHGDDAATSVVARRASDLNNLSVRLGDAGDRAGALQAIDEAVRLRRELAGADPAAFTPNLARR
jgi:hypothetical protein